MFDGSTFTFEGRDDVRCVYQDGEPWFVAQDVAKTMHVKRAEVLLRSLDEDERGLLTLRTLGGDQSMDNAAAYKFMSEAILKKAWDIRKEMRAEFDKDYRDAMRDHRRAK